jgi:polyhydroxybutyrate depolymerase
VQFIRDLIAEISQLTSIDSEHIYVNGMSNGGAMTGRVACEMADEIAAVGMVAALTLDPPECNPARPIPIIAFHGTADPIVRYEGGTTNLPE